MTLKKKMSTKTIRIANFAKLFLLFLVLLGLPLLVTAYGVSSPYWDTRPMIVPPGNTQEFTLELQNMAGGGGDILLRARVDEGADIVTLLDKNLDYFVPFGSKNVNAKVRVHVPEDAVDGQTWKVGISFTQIPTSSEEGMVQLGGGIKTAFPVIVRNAKPVEEETSVSATTLMVLVGLIIVGGAGIGYLLFRKRAGDTL